MDETGVRRPSPSVDLKAIARSARLYFWPIIALNVMAMTRGAGGDYVAMAWFALVIAAMSSFGFLANDLCDRRIDLMNAAGHLEASNPTTVKAARLAALGLGVGGLAIAFWLGPRPFGVAVLSAVALGVYSPVLRRYPLLPNIVTAGLAAGPLWAPLVLAASGGAPWQWWIVTGIVAVLTAREIVMDVRDRPGDVSGGRVTLATRLGPRAATVAGVGLTLAAGVPLVVGVVLAGRQLPSLTQIGAIGLAGVIFWLLLRPLTLVLTSASSVASIQTYVGRSRLAMLLMAGLTWILAMPA